MAVNMGTTGTLWPQCVSTRFDSKYRYVTLYAPRFNSANVGAALGFLKRTFHPKFADFGKVALLHKPPECPYDGAYAPLR
jgi:hypothetical protein